MADAPIPGIERAAILLRVLGEENASRVLQHMDVKEVQAVSKAMVELEAVPTEKVKTVLASFQQVANEQTPFAIGTDKYVRKMLEGAVGQERAKGLLGNMFGNTDTGLDELKWMDAKAIAEILQHEHPQIIALALSALEGSHSAEVMRELPEAMHADILMRVARLESVQPSALEQLKETLVTRFSGGSSKVARSQLSGLKSAAGILNELDPEMQRVLQEKIREQDEELGVSIEELMFVFENLVEVDDRGMQAILREVESDQLVVAMKGASEKIKEKIFNNMSRRAAELLRDDLEMKGPVKLSEVEEAQKQIITVARRLAEEGTIMLGGGGEAYV